MGTGVNVGARGAAKPAALLTSTPVLITTHGRAVACLPEYLHVANLEWFLWHTSFARRIRRLRYLHNLLASTPIFACTQTLHT